MDPGQRPIKRRVRTGCLTCRARRRKCDEGKPECRNCTTKSLACRYASRITFATPWKGPGHQTPSSPSKATQQGERDDQVIGNGQAPASSARRSGGSAAAQENNGGNLDAETGLRANSTPFHLDDYGADNTGSDTLKGCGTSTTARPVPIPSSSDEVDRIAARGTASSEHGGGQHSAPAGIDDTPPMQLIAELNWYRDELANIMDLDMVDAFWGVDVLHLSIQCPPIRQAILDVTRRGMQRARGDAQMSPPQPCDESDISFFHLEHGRTVSLLRGLDMVLSVPPTMWLVQGQELGLSSFPDEARDSVQQLQCRIMLAAMLNAPTNVLSEHCPRAFPAPAIFHLGPARSSAAQLKQALCLLGRSLFFLPSAFSRTNVMPLTSAWSICWSEAQLWYAMRSEDLHPLFQSFGSQVDVFENDTGAAIPDLMFSSALALVANAAHHLTALLLLQQKPRVLQAVAESGSSTSPSWHALRLLGIAAAATHLGTWDPLIATTVVKAAQKLSHPSQLAAASRILQRICAISGMQFAAEIRTLEDLTRMDYSDAF